MIGEIEFLLGRRPCRARLMPDLTWSSSQPDVAALLQRICPADQTPGMTLDELGRHLLYRAGERLGGRVSVRPMPAAV
jgi:hypothetical protein